MSAGAEQIAAMINRFGRELYSRLSAGDARGNLFFSPLSIHAALGMALAGAKGKTARELAEVLHWPAEVRHGAEYAGLMTDPMQFKYASSRLVIANALWAQAGHPLLPDYVRRVEEGFAGNATEVDFARAAEAAGTINDWVARHTAGKIRGLVSPAALGPLTRLLLTNAVYFRADWRRKFTPADTAEAPFHLAGGGTVRVPLMRQKAYFHAADAGRYCVIDLPYADYLMSMRVFVPKSPQDLAWLEETALSGGANAGGEELPWRQVELFLPRFRFEWMLSLAPVLASMGVAEAFDRAAADFTGVTPGRDAWFSDVLHKAYVDVNEEGTEATGATAVMLVAGRGPKPAEPIVVRVDRPFVFTITARPRLGRERLLFMGRVTDPTP
jgi:serpin B